MHCFDNKYNKMMEKVHPMTWEPDPTLLCIPYSERQIIKEKKKRKKKKRKGGKKTNSPIKD